MKPPITRYARSDDVCIAYQVTSSGLGLDIRAGVHIGECEMIGDDVGGVAVHTGARIMAEAASGEVVASSTIKDLVAGSGLTFVDRGVRPLKGVPGEWRLFFAQG